MTIKFILILFIALQFVYSIFTRILTWRQRKKPLPESVAHIYDEEKYQKFLAYKKEYSQISIATDVFSLLLNLFLILSGFYSVFDNPNPYIGFIQVFLILFIVETIVNLPVDYYATFHIEEKYGMNRKTKKEFAKDWLLEHVLGFVVTVVFFYFIIFLCQKLPIWTNNFDISYQQSFLFCLAIVGALLLIVLLLSLLSVLVMRVQYKFTEMEDGELKTKILEYCKESKKKIKKIKVYDESKKSNSKNAFLLKFLWYREFGIADNFLDENSQDELLAVLLHEVGHLKHKKNICNFLSYAIFIALFAFLVWLIPNAQMIVDINGAINEAFGLQYTNYYLSFTAFSLILSPIMSIISIFNNFVSCKEEKEADYNAVDKGYGQALIDTFTKVSEDELIDVNPHPVLEFLEYDHPGIAKRIGYIQERIKENKQKEES